MNTARNYFMSSSNADEKAQKSDFGEDDRRPVEAGESAVADEAAEHGAGAALQRPVGEP